MKNPEGNEPTPENLVQSVDERIDERIARFMAGTADRLSRLDSVEL